MKIEQITIDREELKNILQCATGNIRDFTQNEDGFIDDWIKRILS